MNIRIAILDMNNNTPNKGLGYIKDLVENYPGVGYYQVFDVRAKNEVPDTSFDIYISSGGPGSPWEMDGWEKKYFHLLDQLREHNLQNEVPKKYVFFICHSFQVACIYFKIGEVSKREHMSFGIYPFSKTQDGAQDPVFSMLPEPFFAADFRHWQVVQPDMAYLQEIGSNILALELADDDQADRALMSVRFTDEMVGTQFHPEADDKGMLQYLQEDERRFRIIEDFGMDRYLDMLEHLNDPDKIALTYRTILPGFLEQSIRELREPALAEA
jgi:GMP synthase-like glutamine amidotransferase